MPVTPPIRVVDTHTAGMATRVVMDGVGDLPGATIGERRTFLMAERDYLRTFLMCEPRGHEAMTGALLQSSTRPDADVGVIWMEVQGCIKACGHGVMGVVVALIEDGRVPVTEPVTTIRLDTPSGLVRADIEVHDGRPGEVTIELPASHLLGTDLTVDVPGFGSIGYDLAYGGNHCAIADLAQFGLPFDRRARDDIRRAGLALVDAVSAQREFRHDDGSPAELRHAQLLAPNSTPTHSRHAMVIAPGWFDRSPCGTGTAARMAQLHGRGLLPLGRDFVNESFIGTTFTGRLIAERAGRVVPRITGRAFVTARAEFLLDPQDPLPGGFLI